MVVAADLAVTARDLTKRFGDHDVIRGLTFGVQRGTILGVVGASGGGKTTLMRMLLGLLRPTSGELTVFGHPPHELSAGDRRRFGYAPQLFAYSPDLSVAENMRFAASMYGMSWGRRSPRIRQALDLVNLWDARKRVGRDLSGGMQKRLQLAATLVHDPDIIFLDEPTAGIDPVLRATFWDHFRTLRDDGKTLVITTQYVTESEYCDGILALRDGRIVGRGTPAEVRRDVLGGEVVHIAGAGLDRQLPALVDGVVGVRTVRWLDAGTVEVIVDRAAEAVLALRVALDAAGIAEYEIAEQHPNFDDVFVRMMQGADGATPPPSD